MENGADVNYLSGYIIETPLHIAVFNGHDYIASVLLDFGADYGVKCQCGYTALHYASRKGYVRLIEKLIKVGANVNEKITKIAEFDERLKPQTPLQLSADSGHKNCCEILLKHGASVNERNSNGQTALHIAAIRGNADVVIVLLKNGASLKLQSDDGHTPIQAAEKNGKNEIIPLLKRRI